jgi:hypothetical protein
MIRKFRFFEGIVDDTYVFENVNLNLVERHIERGERSLRVSWNRENIEDLNTHYSIDATEELSRLLAEEIDNEILNELTRRINGGHIA